MKDPVLDRIKTDAPIFEPSAFELTDRQVELCERARILGESKFAARAAKWDREASFPTDNYRDLHDAGLLGICVPRENGGEGADLLTYSHRRRRNRPLLRLDRADLEHACLLVPVDRPARRPARHEREERSPMRAAAPCITGASSRTVKFIRSRSRKAVPPPPARGVRHQGEKGRGWLADQRQKDLRLARRPCRLLRRALHRRSRRRQPAAHHVHGGAGEYQGRRRGR